MADVNLYYGQHFRKNHKNIFEEKIIYNFGNENLTLKMAIFLFRPVSTVLVCASATEPNAKIRMKIGPLVHEL